MFDTNYFNKNMARQYHDEETLKEEFSKKLHIFTTKCPINMVDRAFESLLLDV